MLISGSLARPAPRHFTVLLSVRNLASNQRPAPGVNLKIVEAASVAATDAYVKSFHYGWGTALPFVAIALLIIMALDGSNIKAQMTWLVERPVSCTTSTYESF